MKRILIEWLEHGSEEPAGQSPGEVEELVGSIVETMQPFLRTMQIQLEARSLRLEADEAERADCSWFQKLVQGLGGRADKLSCRGRRDGYGARRWKQGRGRLSARRPVREATAAYGQLGDFLLAAQSAQ